MDFVKSFFSDLALAAKWDSGAAIQRNNAIPLDANSVFESYEDLCKYLAGDVDSMEGSSEYLDNAYPGQVVSVVGVDSTDLYVVAYDAKSATNNLTPVKVQYSIVSDNASVSVENNVITIKDFEQADPDSVPYKDATGRIKWISISDLVTSKVTDVDGTLRGLLDAKVKSLTEQINKEAKNRSDAISALKSLLVGPKYTDDDSIEGIIGTVREQLITKVQELENSIIDPEKGEIASQVAALRSMITQSENPDDVTLDSLNKAIGALSTLLGADVDKRKIKYVDDAISNLRTQLSNQSTTNINAVNETISKLRDELLPTGSSRGYIQQEITRLEEKIRGDIYDDPGTVSLLTITNDINRIKDVLGYDEETGTLEYVDEEIKSLYNKILTGSSTDSSGKDLNLKGLQASIEKIRENVLTGEYNKSEYPLADVKGVLGAIRSELLSKVTDLNELILADKTGELDKRLKSMAELIVGDENSTGTTLYSLTKIIDELHSAFGINVDKKRIKYVDDAVAKLKSELSGASGSKVTLSALATEIAELSEYLLSTPKNPDDPNSGIKMGYIDTQIALLTEKLVGDPYEPEGTVSFHSITQDILQMKNVLGYDGNEKRVYYVDDAIEDLYNLLRTGSKTDSSNKDLNLKGVKQYIDTLKKELVTGNYDADKYPVTGLTGILGALRDALNNNVAKLQQLILDPYEGELVTKLEQLKVLIVGTAEETPLSLLTLNTVLSEFSAILNIDSEDGTVGYVDNAISSLQSLIQGESEEKLDLTVLKQSITELSEYLLSHPADASDPESGMVVGYIDAQIAQLESKLLGDGAAGLSLTSLSKQIEDTNNLLGVDVENQTVSYVDTAIQKLRNLLQTGDEEDDSSNYSLSEIKNVIDELSKMLLGEEGDEESDPVPGYIAEQIEALRLELTGEGEGEGLSIKSVNQKVEDLINVLAVVDQSVGYVDTAVNNLRNEIIGDGEGLSLAGLESSIAQHKTNDPHLTMQQIVSKLASDYIFVIDGIKE